MYKHEESYFAEANGINTGRLYGLRQGREEGLEEGYQRGYNEGHVNGWNEATAVANGKLREQLAYTPTSISLRKKRSRKNSLNTAI